jgi:hypothetical protein
MAIYINGCEIEITDARMIPVWIEHQGYRIKWHYREKSPTRLTKEIREEPVWHFRGKWAHDKKPAYGGKWFAISPAMRAGRGIDEIIETAYRFAPDAKTQFEEWAKADGPCASEIFATIPLKEVA